MINGRNYLNFDGEFGVVINGSYCSLLVYPIIVLSLVTGGDLKCSLPNFSSHIPSWIQGE